MKSILSFLVAAVCLTVVGFGLAGNKSSIVRIDCATSTSARPVSNYDALSVLYPAPNLSESLPPNDPWTYFSEKGLEGNE